METLLAFAVGVMAAGSVYLMLQRQSGQVLFGLILLSNAANLLIFTAGGMTEGLPPSSRRARRACVATNPLPQALILTAIVIGFGLLAFALVLVYRGYQELGTDDTTACAWPSRRSRSGHPEPEEPTAACARCRRRVENVADDASRAGIWSLPIAVPMTTAVLCILSGTGAIFSASSAPCGAGAHLAVALLLMARVWQGGILAGADGRLAARPSASRWSPTCSAPSWCCSPGRRLRRRASSACATSMRTGERERLLPAVSTCC